MSALEQLGMTERQARAILEKILANSPDVSLVDLLSSKVRIVASKVPTFRSLGSITLPDETEVRLCVVSNEELLGLGKSGHGSTSIARALQFGLRQLTEAELSIMRRGWNCFNDLHIQTNECGHEVDVGMTFTYHGDMEDQSLSAWYGPHHQWIFVQS